MFSVHDEGKSLSLTRVNLEHISSASLMRPALSMYLAHFELMKRSAVSRAWASSIHRAASFILPACCGEHRKEGLARNKLMGIIHWPQSRLYSQTTRWADLCRDDNKPCKSWPWWQRARWVSVCCRWLCWCTPEPGWTVLCSQSAEPGNTAPTTGWLEAPPSRHLCTHGTVVSYRKLYIWMGELKNLKQTMSWDQRQERQVRSGITYHFH